MAILQVLMGNSCNESLAKLPNFIARTQTSPSISTAHLLQQ